MTRRSQPLFRFDLLEQHKRLQPFRRELFRDFVADANVSLTQADTELDQADARCTNAIAMCDLFPRSILKPKASDTPTNPIPTCGNAAAMTALPQPANVSQNVPIASAAYFREFISHPLDDQKTVVREWPSLDRLTTSTLIEER